MGQHGLDSFDSGEGQVAGLCEHENNPSGSTNAGNFISSWETNIFSRRNLLRGMS